jgi:hypothetical protein
MGYVEDTYMYIYYIWWSMRAGHAKRVEFAGDVDVGRGGNASSGQGSGRSCAEVKYRSWSCVREYRELESRAELV